MKLTKKDKMELDKKARLCVDIFRKKWNLQIDPIKDLQSLVKAKGFLLLKFPNDLGISGVFMNKKDRDRDYGCIYINNNEPLGRQYFTLAHELYHAYFEKSQQGVCFNESKDPIEITANNFASHLLVPRSILFEVLNALYTKRMNGKNIKIQDLFEIQKMFNVTLQAVLYSIDDLKNYKEYITAIPKNIDMYKKYYLPKYWDELNNKSQKYGINLNLCFPKYEFPENFKRNLISNYDKGRVDREDIEEIFNFFEETFSL